MVTIRVKVELTLELVDKLKPRAAKGSDQPSARKAPQSRGQAPLRYMKKHRVKRIIGNDKDFDGLDAERTF